MEWPPGLEWSPGLGMAPRGRECCRECAPRALGR